MYLNKIVQVVLAVLNVTIFALSIVATSFYSMATAYQIIPALLVFLGLFYDSRGPKNKFSKLFCGLNYLWNAINQFVFSGLILLTVAEEIRQSQYSEVVNRSRTFEMLRAICYIGKPNFPLFEYDLIDYQGSHRR